MTNTVSKLEEYNNFLGLNIGNSPSYVLERRLWANGAWLLVIGAIAIPVLCLLLTQWINVKLMPQQDKLLLTMAMIRGSNGFFHEAMNMIMPHNLHGSVLHYLPVWVCTGLQVALSEYQQIVINKHIDKMNFDDIREECEKAEKK